MLAYHAVHKGLPLSRIFGEVFKGNSAKYKLWHRNYYQPLYELKVNKELYQRKQTSASAYMQTLIQKVDQLKKYVEHVQGHVTEQKASLKEVNPYSRQNLKLIKELTAKDEILMQGVIQDMAEEYKRQLPYLTALRKDIAEKNREIRSTMNKINTMQQQQQYSEEYYLLLLLNAI